MDATVPSLDALLSDAAVVSLPLRTRFRGLDRRELMLLRGPRGWAEFSPFVEYDDREAAAWLQATCDEGWGPEVPHYRDSIPVNATLPAVAAAQVPAVLERFGAVRTVKVKVAERGQTLDDDVARVRAAREHLGPAGRIRVDANGAWNVDEAEHAAHLLAPFDLEYLEQPCASVDELAELRERLRDWQLPIAADAGLPVVISSALESSVGLSMGARLAAAVPELLFDCGLGTAALLAADVTREPLVPVNGEVPVRRIDVDGDLVREHAAAPDRVAWWRDRLERCHRLLTEGE